MYASKFGITRQKMMKRLWGDNFLSNDTKKWSHQSTAKAGQKGDRGFCVFVLTPIETLFRSIMDGKKEIYEAMLPKLGITIPKENREDVGKPLLKVCMQVRRQDDSAAAETTAQQAWCAVSEC
jgi:elongation factor 2